MHGRAVWRGAAFFLALLFAAAAVLGGCGGKAQAPASEGQVLRLMIGDEPPDMVAQTTTDTISIMLLSAVQEGLVRLGPDGKPVPGMAEKWEVSSDGKTYTFHLRKDAKWSNGDPVTAKDFLAGWKLVLDPHMAAEYANLITDYVVGAEDYYNYQRYLMFKEQAEKSPDEYQKAHGDKTPAEVVYGKKMDAVPEVTFDAVALKAKDDYTIEITLKEPIPYFFDLLAFPTYFPLNEKFYTANKEKYGSDPQYLLYNGPFVLSEWAHGSKVVLTKNPNYWDKDTVKLDKITFDVVKDVNTAVNLYLTGKVDRTGLASEQVPKYKDRPDYHTFVQYVTFYLQFNTQKKPFDNAKVRKALAYAIDRKAFIQTVLQTDSVPAYGLVPETEPAWAGADTTFRDWSKKMFGGPLFQDVGGNPALKAEAKKLLEEGLRESGIDPAKFTFEYLTDDSDVARKSAEFFKSMWKENLGIDVEIKTVVFKERLNRMKTGDFTVVLAGWGADYDDPETWFGLFEKGNPFNYGKYSNPAYDEALKKARTAGTDLTKRTNAYAEAEKILIQDDMGIAPVYYRVISYLQQPYVKNLIQRASGPDLEFKWAYIDTSAKK
ncbi:peptide ABC transporter substrate-binding protein [Brockia lithotrophica]|uniref:Oligopeptide transport system substrate-binding protein n=1 Tax=Brockia lithotrophica TaxID=933949 RepID=A0A660L7E1_9BACL|nr:peptide ABC transporter substrate-binding protein [Brockia lithotrophica]RKQ89124.1 oligopeptide transport system substrate-binding protein [Brockia lithotrophica]